MATKELPINADQDGIPQSLSKNFDQTGNSSGFIFDESYRRRLRQMAKTKPSSETQRSAFARIARQDESLLAGSELSMHRPDLPV